MGEFSKPTGIALFVEQFADSPHLLSFFEANFGTAEQAAIRRDLLDASDASEFSLRQWVESLRTLRSWLDERGLTMSVEDEIGYIHCAGEVAGHSSHLTYLPALVTDMLETYGCERAVPRCASETDSGE